MQDMSKMDKRLNLKLTDEEMQRLQELAAANAGRNNSLMVRDLINLAWERHNILGLHAPKADALAVSPN